jgi:hypothetical protein
VLTTPSPPLEKIVESAECVRGLDMDPGAESGL